MYLPSAGPVGVELVLSAGSKCGSGNSVWLQRPASIGLGGGYSMWKLRTRQRAVGGQLPSWM
jgi:hypothetical protein